MQNEKLGAGKPREFDQSTHSLIKMLQRKIRGFHLRVSVLGIEQNGQLGVEKPRKGILRGFRVFDLTSESMLNAKKENED